MNHLEKLSIVKYAMSANNPGMTREQVLAQAKARNLQLSDDGKSWIQMAGQHHPGKTRDEVLNTAGRRSLMLGPQQQKWIQAPNRYQGPEYNQYKHLQGSSPREIAAAHMLFREPVPGAYDDRPGTREERLEFQDDALRAHKGTFRRSDSPLARFLNRPRQVSRPQPPVSSGPNLSLGRTQQPSPPMATGSQLRKLNVPENLQLNPHLINDPSGSLQPRSQLPAAGVPVHGAMPPAPSRPSPQAQYDSLPGARPPNPFKLVGLGPPGKTIRS